MDIIDVDVSQNPYIKIKTTDSTNERKRLNKKKNKKRNKDKNINKSSLFPNLLKYIFSFIAILIIMIIIITIYNSSKGKNSNISNNNITYSYTMAQITKNPLIRKDPEKEYEDSQEYMKMIKNGLLYDKDKIFYPTQNPKISIILPVYNGEGFLNKTILSIQNQDFKDIEIIVVDDQSTDNSVGLIKELMKTEPRISLYQNDENRGILYTKTKGVLLAKGRYVMIIDDDDRYLQRDAFTTLYSEAEKDNLDILRFKYIQTTMFSVKDLYNHEDKDETPIIYQPELSNFMFYRREDGNIMRNGGNLYNQIFRTDLFQTVIKEDIDNKYINTKIKYHDDLILFFLLTRKAKSLKQISRIFYVIVITKFIHNPKVDYRREEKFKDRYNDICGANLNYVEILFEKTKNTIEDKKIPFSQFQTLYMDNECQNNIEFKKKGMDLCNLFLESGYIEEKDKNKIKDFMDRITRKDSSTDNI